MLNKNYFKFIKFFAFYVVVIILVYSNYLLKNDFIIDDYAIISSKIFNFKDFYNSFLSAFANRPLAIIYYYIISRLDDKFIIYASISLSFYLISIAILFRVFDFLLNSETKKIIFFLTIIFQFFSYTNIYSPGMQSIGNFSLLLFVLSLFFFKSFLITKNYYNYLISIVLIIVSLLIYESFFPLLIIYVMLPFFFKFNYKYFLYNLLIIFSVILVIFIYQKYFAILIYSAEDLSRFRNTNFLKIIEFTILNIFVLIDFLFSQLYYAQKNIINLFNKNLYFEILKIIILFFIFTYFILKNSQKNYNKIKFSLIFFLILGTIFLTLLMHSLANTVISPLDYNNRGLVALSILFPLSLILFKNINFRNYKIKLSIQIFFILMYLTLLINFFSFQIYQNERYEIQKKVFKIISDLNLTKSNTFILTKNYNLLDIEKKFNYNNNYFDNFNKNSSIITAQLSGNIICNKDIFIFEKLKAAKKNNITNFIIYDVSNKYVENFSTYEEMHLYLSTKKNLCNSQHNILINKIFKKEKYLYNYEVPIILKNNTMLKILQSFYY
jgi:hypothetical protein